MIIILLGIILSVAFITLLERKLMGHMQRRIGPNQVGYLGILQPITDGIKLILKETVSPSNRRIKGEFTSYYLFFIAPFITFYLSLANWLILPLDYNLFISEIPGGILILIAITELGIFGVLYAGWSAQSKYPLIGSIRSTAQMISYSISLSIILLTIIFIIGDINLMTIANSSTNSIRYKILLPIIPLFIVSALAETNRSPFDLPEAESELVAGFFTEHSAIAFVFFFLAEYTSILTLSTLFSILLFSSHVNLLFTFILLIIILWIRAVLPRFRFDQLLKLGWTVILPFTITYGGLFLPALLFSFDLYA